MATDLSKTVSSITNDIVDFYHGMRDYWSTRTLMQGYGEAAKDITELVQDATRDSNPLVQACAGSGLAVAKMLGAIPIGIDHWVIETARSTVHHGLGAGFKTLLGTPIEGFVDGGKFVINQVKNWSQGNISSSTMGVADEVASTLGAAGLMFLGIKGIHTGGTGLINGLKNIEISSPALTTTNGLAIPVVRGAETITGGGPITQGLIYMSGTKGSSDGPGSSDGKGPVDFKQITKDAVRGEEAKEVLIEGAKRGEREAIAGLIEMANGNSIWACNNLFSLASEGSELVLEEMCRLLREDPNASIVDTLSTVVTIFHPFKSADLRGRALRIFEGFRNLDLDAVLTQDKFQDTRYTRYKILKMKALAGDTRADDALYHLAQKGDDKAQRFYASYKHMKGPSLLEILFGDWMID